MVSRPLFRHRHKTEPTEHALTELHKALERSLFCPRQKYRRDSSQLRDDLEELDRKRVTPLGQLEPEKKTLKSRPGQPRRQQSLCGTARTSRKPKETQLVQVQVRKVKQVTMSASRAETPPTTLTKKLKTPDESESITKETATVPRQEEGNEGLGTPERPQDGRTESQGTGTTTF